jgi:hypothetical protein
VKLGTQRLLAFGALGLVLLTSSTATSARARLKGRLDATAVRQIAAPVASLIHQPGLPRMLAAVAYTESRFRTDIVNDAGMVGIYQLHPGSMRLDDAGVTRSALFDPRVSSAIIAWYYERLRPYAKAGQTIDWLALRRGSAYPNLVADTDESEQRSIDVRQRFATALDATGTPRSFMHEAAFPPGYHWPGIGAVLNAALGRGSIA